MQVIPFWPVLLLGLYCLCIAAASLLGGWLPSLVKLTHTRMQLTISFIGGFMLGVALFHMLPSAVEELGPDSISRASLWMAVGLLVMFFLIRLFHFHEHESAEIPDLLEPSMTGGSPVERSMDHGLRRAHPHETSWVGVAAGLTIHTLAEGVALAATVQSDAGAASGQLLLGLGTFLAIVLHKPLAAVSITSLMSVAGRPAYWRNAINVGFSLMCPLGAGLFFLGIEQYSVHEHILIGCALAFSAGTFLCISLADLLPEMELHSHNRVRLSAMLLLGIALSWLIGAIEPKPPAKPAAILQPSGDFSAPSDRSPQMNLRGYSSDASDHRRAEPRPRRRRIARG